METNHIQKQLREAYEAFRSKPFPPGCADDIAGEFHAELALFSTELNGLLTRALGARKGERLFGPEDEWRYRDLKTRLEYFVRDGTSEAARRAGDYLEYLEALWNVAELARKSL